MNTGTTEHLVPFTVTQPKQHEDPRKRIIIEIQTSMPTSNRILTFEQFAGARRFTPDIGTELSAEGEIGEPGYIYPGDWYINQFDGEFLLIIGNESWKSPDLGELEQVLYTEWYLPESGGITD